MSELKTVGKSEIRVDVKGKVTGATEYAADIKMRGMLHAYFVRCFDHAHAKITKLDMSEAAKEPGVVKVVGPEDVTDKVFNQSVIDVMVPPSQVQPLGDIEDQKIFADGRVKHYGEAICAIIATTEAAAEYAASKVIVEYEPLPVYLDAQSAKQTDAVQFDDRKPGNLAFELPEALFPGKAMGWGDVDALEELPPRMTGVILANELLDNMPVALALRAGDEWQERMVRVNDAGRFVLVPVPARPEVAAWAAAFAGGTPDGGLVEVQLQADAWVIAALDRLDAGTLLLFDYGGTAEELVSRRTQGTLRTYRAHHLGPDPLEAPGETDVTVDVNFSSVAAAAAESAATVEVIRQDEYLVRWGLRDVVADLRRRELDLAREGDPVERLQLRSERTDAETLLHPRGLGDFRVLIAVK